MIQAGATMARITVNGVDLHYTETGRGTETLVFSHGLLMSGEMFARQVEHFSKRFRCITYDHRGQGSSGVPAGGYDMDTLALDAAALIAALGAAPCHFVGLSMGGFVGLRLAIRQPALLSSLILIETSADPEPEQNKPRYRLLNFIARWFGIGLVVGRVMPILFGRTILGDPAREAERAEWRRRIAGNHRVGITRAVAGVIDREGVYDRLSAITTPTLILVGDEDVATVPQKSEHMRAAIGSATLRVIPRAGHSSTIEQPDAVTRAIEEFLDGQRSSRR